jgi:hypothetical protein
MRTEELSSGLKPCKISPQTSSGKRWQ